MARAGPPGRGRPIKNTGAAVPWSVPALAFSRRRRPNSEKISTVTRSPSPERSISAMNDRTERLNSKSREECWLS